MSLSQLLDGVDGGRHLWITRGARYSADQVRRAVSDTRRSLGAYRNLRVALEATNTIDALVWMLALDGIAESVLLMPASLIGTDVHQCLKARFDPHKTISDASCPGLSTGNAGHTPTLTNSDGVDTRWVLATSGTTGTPKLISHSASSLTRTCKVDRITGGRYIWALVFEPFRFAGLQVVLQSMASGSSLVLCHECVDIPGQVSLMRECSVNALSATPSYWRKLLFSGAFNGWQLHQITLGGEPADQSILAALRKACPEARIRHIYASTEAGVGFSVTDGLAGFPLKFLQEGAGGNRLDIGPEGTLRIRVATMNLATADEKSLVDRDGYIDTGDLVTISGDRVFFLGRSSGAINVGGNKVIPEEIETVIREVEGVAEALVRPQSSSVVGQLVVAIVQPETGSVDAGELKARIRAHCRARLDRHKVPAMIRVVDDIAQNSTGKISRT